MTTIHLAYLAKPTRGGWPTYTAHLAHGLKTAGHDVNLWRLGRRTEDRDRPFGRGLQYRNASPEYLTELARTEKVHITAASAGDHHIVAALLKAGATITIHDPTETKGDMGKALYETTEPIVVIRRAVEHYIYRRIGEVPTRFVRHPYQRMPNPVEPKNRVHAVAFSRLDWDKGTHYIVEANRRLPEDRAVHLYGAENRLYTHHKLEVIDQDWRRNFHGPWPVTDLWGGVKIAARATAAVDMSAIKGDGGGTQYTFLEAIDAGAGLVLNSAWLTMDLGTNDMLDAATFVDPEFLADALLEELPPTSTSGLLELHNAKARALETVGIS